MKLKPHRLTVDELLALFPGGELFESTETVQGANVPEPYRTLLVHSHHMTVTVEAHHESRVALRIIERTQTGAHYARKILLATETTGRVVLFGIMRFDLRFASPRVRQAIVEGRTPLGRILIENDVMRQIEPLRYFGVVPGAELSEHFGCPREAWTYGRLATIHCNGEPAVDLLEIVAPETAGSAKG